MPFRTVPSIGPRYWTGITLASVFGANMGDFVSHDLHMGHVRGLPALALVFAAVIVGNRMTPRGSEVWYWLAIVTLRTAATNLGDLATHDGALGFGPVSLVLAAVLVAVLSMRRFAAPEFNTQDVPQADGSYWLAMLIAGTLGTALGDGLADVLSLPVATAFTAAAVIFTLGLRRSGNLRGAATYWLAIAAIRTFGTNAGDMLAHASGLPTSTAVSGMLLVSVLALWPGRQTKAPRSAPSAA